MNSTESLPSYRGKEDFKSSEIFPSMFRLVIMYIGAMDTTFGIIGLIVSLQKSVFDILIYLFVLLSLIGGISCIMVAKEPNIQKINNPLKIGFAIGLVICVIYFYFIIRIFTSHQ
jgi:hypothetical protein